MQQNTPHTQQTRLESILCVVSIFLVIGVFLSFAAQFFSQKRFTKSDLCLLYGIDGDTLSSWIYFFCRDIFQKDGKYTYPHRRVFSKREFRRILKRLGTGCFGMNSLFKSEIARRCDSNTHCLRRAVLAYPRSYGLTKKAFKRIDRFPPKVCAKIMAHFN